MHFFERGVVFEKSKINFEILNYIDVRSLIVEENCKTVEKKFRKYGVRADFFLTLKTLKRKSTSYYSTQGHRLQITRSRTCSEVELVIEDIQFLLKTLSE